VASGTRRANEHELEKWLFSDGFDVERAWQLYLSLPIRRTWETSSVTWSVCFLEVEVEVEGVV